LKGIEYWR
jgi:hypothetical protein